MQHEFTSLMFAIIAVLLAAWGRAFEFITAVSLTAVVLVLWRLHQSTAQGFNSQKLESHDLRNLIKALAAEAKLTRKKLGQHNIDSDQFLQATKAEYAMLLETMKNQRDAARAESTTARRLLRHRAFSHADFIQVVKGRVANGARCAYKPLTNVAVAAGAVPGLISWAPAATYPPRATPLSPSSSIVPTAATTYSASIDMAVAAKVFLDLLNQVSVPTSSIPSSPSAVSTRTPSLLPKSAASTSSSQIADTAGPSTDKQASPLLTKSTVSTAKPSLPLKSADLPAATSSRTMPAETSVTTLVEAPAATSDHPATPVKMTEAAEVHDPISQDSVASVSLPVPSLSVPTPANLSAKPTAADAKPSLPPKSVDMATTTSSQSTPASNSVATPPPSLKLVEAPAATSNHAATPVKMTEAAEVHDPISQDSVASVSPPVPSLLVPTLASPPSTIKPGQSSKFASPLSANSTPTDVKPPKSVDMAAITSSQSTPASISVATPPPSPKLVEAPAATSNHAATPVKMAEAAEFHDPISQDSVASVPPPDPSLLVPTLASPPSTIKPGQSSKFASPLSANSTPTDVKSSLPPKSADMAATTSSQATPVRISVAPPTLVETPAAKPAPTPVKMTEAAEFHDPISQDSVASVPPPVVALSLPASISANPPTTLVSPIPAQRPAVSAAANISHSSAAAGASKPSLPTDATLVNIATRVPLPPPDEDEKIFFSKDSPLKHTKRPVQATRVNPKVPRRPVVIPPVQRKARSHVVTESPMIKRADLGLEHEKRNRQKLMPKRRSVNQRNATLEGTQLKARPTEAQTELKDSKMKLTVEPKLEEKRAQMEAAQSTAELEPKQSKPEQTVESADVLPTLPDKNTLIPPAIKTPTACARVPSVFPTKNTPSPPAKIVPTSTLTPVASSVVDAMIKPVDAATAPATTSAVLVPTTETAVPTTEAAVTTTEETETTTTIAQPEPVTTAAASTEAQIPAPQKEVDPTTLDQKKPAMETKPKEDPNGWIDALDYETKLGIVKLVSQAREALNSAQDPVDMFQNIDGYFAKTMDLSVRTIETHYQYLQKTGFVQSTYEVKELLPSVLKALPDYFILEH
ncbi:hypothetical protein HDU77_002396 [Chytriomyces hyalinus]|nr:hypothetical protein HDU77_002396 [Chytriomyces hyalinus]